MKSNRFLVLLIVALMMSIEVYSLSDLNLINVTVEHTGGCCIKIIVETGHEAFVYVDSKMEVFDQELLSWTVIDEGQLGPTLRREAVYCDNPGPSTIEWKVTLTSGVYTRVVTDSIDVGVCCECPDVDSDWLTLNMDSESENCGPGQCEVTPILDIPQSQKDSCYQYYNCKTADTDFNQQNSSINDPLPTYCISNGQMLDFELVLMKYSTDDPDDPRFEHCILRDSVGPCEMNDGDPCYPDYPEVAFEDGVPFEFTMGPDSPCQDCVVSVDYVWREPGNRQDLQITGIYFDENGPCAGCTIEDIYEQALPQAMLQCINEHDFEPDRTGEINDQWRVSQAGCWGKKIAFYPTYITYRWVPCGCDECGCCLHRFEVEMVDATTQTLDITPIGTPIVFDAQCDTIMYDTEMNGPCNPDWKPCEAACEWPGLVNGEYRALKTTQAQTKLAFNNEIPEHEVSSIYHQDELNVEVHTAGAETAIITIYDINGIVAKEREFDIHRGMNYLTLSTSDLITGTYLYIITIDGRTSPVEKLIIVR